jgi:hypothetical protein
MFAITANRLAAVAFAFLMAPLVALGSDAQEQALKIQGEYVGALKTPDNDFKVGVQVIALGDGKFHAVALPGGLPGDGWDGSARLESDGELKDGVVTFHGDQVRAELKEGVIRVFSGDGEPMGRLERVERKSATLGAPPPAGAIALFDGSNAAEFVDGKVTDDGLLIAGATSKRTFQDGQLHVEFLLPFMPEARGQGRGNSGCYLQGRYEVQMLDSFGLEGLDNECGGIYRVAKPGVNMCFPPSAWPKTSRPIERTRNSLPP